ncbi:unnamed protein product, partial [Rotaria sordida]
MPRLKLCQHPTAHTGSSYIAKGSRLISSHLRNFIWDRYGFEELNIRWLCPKCQRVETEMMKKQQEMVEEDNMNISGDELRGNSSMDNEAEDDGSDSQDDEDDSQDNEKQSEEEMFLEVTYQKEQAMRQLSAVFELLKMDPVQDKFESTQHQARQSLALRENEGILAFPQYFKGNQPISDDTITTIVDFYHQDGISRMSSNSKNTIKINQNTVPIRYMEMTVLDAFRIFDERFPGLAGRTTFYSSRPRDQQLETAKAAGKHQPAIDVFFLEEKEIQRTK